MPDSRDHNSGFHEVWDTIHDRLREPGFDLNASLAEAAGYLSAASVRELRIAASLGDLFSLAADFDHWRLSEEARIVKWRNFSSRLNRLGWVAAAAVLIVALLIGSPYPEDKPDKAGFRNVFAPFSLTTAVSAAVEKYGIPDVETRFTKTGERLTSINPMLYDDLEGDGKIEMLYSQGGYIICLDQSGLDRWVFNIDDYKPILETTFFRELEMSRRFWQNNASNLYFDTEERRRLISGMDDIDAAWPLIFRPQVGIAGIVDFDRDGFKEVLVNFPGAIFVLGHEDGVPQDIQIDGENRMYIKLLDGDFFTSPQVIEDVNGDGDYEFIIYRSTNWPVNIDGGLLAGRDSGPYIYDGQPFNSRGLYVASHKGEEIWHLNLPYHSNHVSVGDWDNDGHDEIVIDTYLPNNGYIVKYKTDEERALAGSAFNWSSFPDDIEELVDPLPWDVPGDEPQESVLLIFGMNEDVGSIEHLSRVKGDSKHFYTVGRFIDFNGYGRVEVLQFNDHKTTPDEPYWYLPWHYNGREFERLDKIEGLYPEMRWQDGLFGFDTGGGPRLVFGLSPKGIVKVVDEYYGDIAEYRFELQTGSWKVPWDCDAIVYDVADIDGDGSPEILAGFGALHAPWGYANATGYQNRDVPIVSFMKILTEDLKPFHPENGWDTFEVAGPVLQAGFEDLNNDNQVDIFIISDIVYFLTPGN
jgi:hypothetical protein